MCWSKASRGGAVDCHVLERSWVYGVEPTAPGLKCRGGVARKGFVGQRVQLLLIYYDSHGVAIYVTRPASDVRSPIPLSKDDVADETCQSESLSPAAQLVALALTYKVKTFQAQAQDTFEHWKA